MAVTITYFVHGTTIDNESDLATGQQEGELSPLGIKQAKDLGQKNQKRFDAVFCSDLKRAIVSAQLGFSDYEIIVDKRLREADYGDFTGKPCEEFKTKLKDYINKQFPNGESFKDVEKRMQSFLNHLKKNRDGQHIAVIAHQAPQFVLDVLCNRKAWEQAIDEDWRPKGEWKPGWDYFFE